MGKVIAIDGPAGAGKSTTARLVAARLGYTYFDSGALYRAAALLALEQGIPLEDEEKLAEVAKTMNLRFQTEEERNRVFIGDREITEAIRTPEIDRVVTPVAALPRVRKAIVERLQGMARDKNVVAEGRDISTVVFPTADLKIYLDAAPDERVKRRLLEYQAVDKQADPELLAEDLKRRDRADRSRSEGALKIAPDAVVIDTTGLSVEEQVAKVLALAKEKLAKAEDKKGGVKRSKMKWFYLLVWSSVRNLSRILWRLSREGIENIPREGGVIIASNHISWYDPPFVSVSCPREVHFMAKRELFSIPVLGLVIRNLNAFPVSRGKYDRQALEAAIEVLKKGEALIVFPEGTRSRKKGEFLPPKAGIGVLAREGQVPIVPTYISGSDELPKVFFSFGRVRVIFGKPIPKEWVKSLPEGKPGYQQIAEEVMRKIGELKKSCLGSSVV
ncbi:MAG: (d)CMP kinase [candidate division Zixibacteria bacterium]|nr:(d)CMP kinase [candidate division Zixibacteria bacterium]